MTIKRKRKNRVTVFVVLLLAACIVTPMLIFADEMPTRLGAMANLPSADAMITESETVTENEMSTENAAPEINDVIFDPNPETKEDVLAHIEAFEAAVLAGDYEAALSAKPRWEHPVDSSLMPEHWFTERVADDGFGADYYTFFVEIMPLAR